MAFMRIMRKTDLCFKDHDAVYSASGISTAFSEVEGHSL